MTNPRTPLEQENDRLAALRRTTLLQEMPDPVFDRIVELASRLLGTSIGCVTIVDARHLWFKASTRGSQYRVEREHAFCAHTIAGNDVLVVPDLKRDARFADNPFVTDEPFVRFYAGAPLASEGYNVGALCVLDTVARSDFGERERTILRQLADFLENWLQAANHPLFRDPTTGIYTRQRMLSVLKHELAQSSVCPNMHVRLIGIVDISVPKQMHELTQVMGHEQTERFIVECIDRLSDKIGANRELYRIGLYRFGFFMTEQVGIGIQRKLDALVQSLHEPFDSQVGLLLQPSAKLGVTILREHDNDNAEEILRQASVAADDAWDHSRRWTFYKPQSDASRQRKLQLLTELPAALTSNDQLYLLFQPQIDLATQACVGVEALLRWQHPTLGFVSPIELIDAAEKTALIQPLTNWVLDAAIAQGVRWRAEGLNLRVAVNLSAHDLADDRIVERVSQRLRDHDLPGENLELEFTESTLISDLDASLPKLRQLHMLGVSTAIDDFGTGYCNLSYLQKLSASKIKIDRRFVQDIERNPRGQTLTRAIINLAHDLGYELIAEGIENESTLALMADWGCEQAQGYLFSRPLTPEHLNRWIANGGAARVLARRVAERDDAQALYAKRVSQPGHDVDDER
ncbi:putative EAL domain-containing protein [Salinisphaera sp. T5B8]|uniref:putative bifunctional diguanylate cyclase/phosphodiesterase n=1 Tax=unclassified Salinisphaera TaxID=2649847 RepID=UPI00333FB650